MADIVAAGNLAHKGHAQISHEFPAPVFLLAPVQSRRQLALRALRDGQPSRALPGVFDAIRIPSLP